MRIAFLTLGCKVNSYETEKMKLQFETEGHQIVSFSEKADVYVVNTCTVTNIADRKSRKMLHRARRMNPAAIVVAAGCYVDSAAKKGEEDESVDLFIKNEDKGKMVSLVENKLQEKGILNDEKCPEHAGGEMSEKAEKELHTRAYIKIQNGCNQYCSYCIIPYVRGKLESRPDEEILSETKKLAAAGFHEIVLTGIHLSSFGVDREFDKINADSFLKLQGKYLLGLLRKMAEIPGIERLRLGSLEPRIITEEFVKKLAEIPEICPHFHLSLQSGCDDTLIRMNRHYSTEDYLQCVGILRKYFEKPAVTTDIIVGFPGETETEFETTCEFAKKVRFAQIHVFKYSRRHGTVADKMKEQVDEQIKNIRSDKLLAIERDLESLYQEKFMGRTQKVLFEEAVLIDGKKYLVGYNERYVRTGLLYEEGKCDESLCNSIVSVKVTGRINEEILQAEMERACNL
ncbi:MAG: tRNA (N(6)-L-threonylcarbamoyladenosine(37)-C(2))-methylthiotransferase MtaB [Lachnospiraceae bacterium]|nr:tRNA (N(6)-L-threonylcarbamoyladenosine(37)-C(2))-methylthiotransferase MtaB [Lachnospiraceae bacterium]